MLIGNQKKRSDVEVGQVILWGEVAGGLLPVSRLSEDHSVPRPHQNAMPCRASGFRNGPTKTQDSDDITLEHYGDSIDS